MKLSKEDITKYTTDEEFYSLKEEVKAEEVKFAMPVEEMYSYLEE